jgi:hypothetical protein
MKYQKRRAVPLTESLPSVIERLIAAANAQDTEGFVGAFTPDAVIDDWGRQVTGHDEIRAWGGCEFTGPDVRIGLTRIERIGQTTVLTVLTSRGTSNGSAHFAFDIDDGLVARMTIRA